jgi:hypothetical protein
MARASWCLINQQTGTITGSGNSTLPVKASTANTGRKQRSTTITGVASGVTPNPTVSVVQAGKPLFAEWQDSGSAVTDITTDKTEKTLTLTLKTNAAKLKFSVVSDTGGMLGESTIDTMDVGGTTVQNDTDITGDPGLDAEFSVTIKVNIKLNETVSARSATLSVVPKTSDEEGSAVQLQINQSAGEATLKLSPSSITLNWNGDAQNITITSNTSWSLT